jgi:hypothetical protein
MTDAEVLNMMCPILGSVDRSQLVTSYPCNQMWAIQCVELQYVEPLSMDNMVDIIIGK